MDLQALGILTLGLIWGWFNLRVLGWERRLQRDGTPVEATVVGRSMRTSSDGSTGHLLHVAYDAPNGSSYTRKLLVHSSDYEAVTDGAAITLMVDRFRPRRSCLADGCLTATDQMNVDLWRDSEEPVMRAIGRALAFFAWVPPVALVIGGLLGAIF